MNCDENFDDSGDCGELHGYVCSKVTLLEQMLPAKRLQSVKLKFPSNFLGFVFMNDSKTSIECKVSRKQSFLL